MGPIPVEVLSVAAAALPHIVDGLKAGSKPEDIYETLKKSLAPDALELLEFGLNILFPGSGSVLALVVWAAENLNTLPPEGRRVADPDVFNFPTQVSVNG
jgi:hypothetical protein